MKLNKEKQVIIMIIVIVITMALFAVLVKQSIDSNKMVKQTPRVSQAVENREVNNQVEENGEELDNNLDEEEPEIIASDIDTSDWQTYRNEEYGFEFIFPKNYILNRADNQKTDDSQKPWYERKDFLIETTYLFNNEEEIMSLRVLNTIDDNKIESSGGWESINKSSSQKLGYNMVDIFSIDNGDSKLKVIKKNDKSYVFYCESNIVIIDKIISSFQLID